MGTRTVFQILDGDRNLIATLFANSSHTTQFAEDVFEKSLKEGASRSGPNALIEQLIAKRYETAEGNHQAGDRVFWFVSADEADIGDRESVVKVTHAGIGEELHEKGYSALNGSAWNIERIACNVDSNSAETPASKPARMRP